MHLYSPFFLELRPILLTAADSDRPIKQICIKILDPKQKVQLLSLLSTIFCVLQNAFVNVQITQMDIASTFLLKVFKTEIRLSS